MRIYKHTSYIVCVFVFQIPDDGYDDDDDDDRWRSSAMELILTSFLSPILWAIPQGAVQNMMINLHPTDLAQVT